MTAGAAGAFGAFRRRATHDIDQEIRHHIQECADLLIGQGWGREEALREAERRFGAVTRIRAELLEVRGEANDPAGFSSAVGVVLSSTGRDARHAVRAMLTRPAFTLPILLTLGLGLGAAAGIFSVVDAALLRPLAYRNAERLVEVKPAGTGGSSGTIPAAAIADFLAGASTVADGWLAYRQETLVRTDGAAAEQLGVLAVTPGADTLLGIPLLMGRSFSAEDARPGRPDVVVLARPYFERLGGDASLLGRTIRLESGPATVIGVLEGGVRFPEYGGYPDLWMPLRDDFTFASFPDAYAMELWLRLRADVQLAAARERAEALAAGLRELGQLRPDRSIALQRVGEFRANPDMRRGLWALAATALALFLVALVNGVNLLLARASARGRELAVRMAIGGSRARLLRQLVVEGLLLGLAGGAMAAALAWAAVRALRDRLPSELLFFTPHTFGVEGRTLALTLALAVLGGVTVGLVPAHHMVRPGRLSPALAGRASDEAPSARRLGNGLVVAQVALSMALLAAAGLFVKSFAALVRVDPGFEHRRVAFAMIPLSEVRYREPDDRAELVRRLEEALEARPEVAGVSVGGAGGFSFGVALEAEGREAPSGQDFLVPFGRVAPDYVSVTGMDLVEGRTFDAVDLETGGAIIDLDLARYLWSGESPLGRRFRIDQDEEWQTVVGVVRELRLMGRDQRDGPHQILYPADPERPGRMLSVAVRTPGDPRELLPIIQETLRGLDPQQYIWKLQTGAEALAEEEQQPRFLVTLMSLLAGVAVTLAAVGLYGVLAYSVTRRNRELGIRVALGADGRRVRGMVLLEGLRVAGAGVALGGATALLASSALEQLLFEVEPGDPGTLLGTALLFLLIAAVASAIPALRATRVDPVRVLNAE